MRSGRRDEVVIADHLKMRPGTGREQSHALVIVFGQRILDGDNRDIARHQEEQKVDELVAG